MAKKGEAESQSREKERAKQRSDAKICELHAILSGEGDPIYVSDFAANRVS